MSNPSTFQKWNIRLGKLFTGLILGFLAFLLFALFIYHPHPSRERINKVKCSNNLRQIGQAIESYFANHHQYPDALSRLVELIKLDPELLICPETNPTSTTSTSRPNDPHCYVYLPPTTNPLDPSCILTYENLKNHNDDGSNILFGDGRVDWYSKPQVQYMISELEAGYNPPRDKRNTASSTTKP